MANDSMIDKNSAIHFVSQLTHKILDLAGEGKISFEAANALIDTMKKYGFLDKHPDFFDGVKNLLAMINEN